MPDFPFKVGDKVRINAPLTGPSYEKNPTLGIWVNRLPGYNGKVLTIREVSPEYECVSIDTEDGYYWNFHIDWVYLDEPQQALAPCLVGRDVPGYTDTYVSGDDFLKITQQLAEGRGM